MPVFIAPIAGALFDRIGGRTLLATGLGLQAVGLGWLAAVISPTVPYLTLVPAFVVSGVGMSLFFAPVANVVLSSVRRDQEGIASGANNAIRELGGVSGIAVLGAVFSARGGYASGTAFVSRARAQAVSVGAAGGGRRRGRGPVPAAGFPPGGSQPRRRGSPRPGSLTTPERTQTPRGPGFRAFLGPRPGPALPSHRSPAYRPGPRGDRPEPAGRRPRSPGRGAGR